MGQYINFNGKILAQDEPVFTASSRAARFGDGLFETMRLMNGKILFEELHAARLFKGLSILRFALPPQFDWALLRTAMFELLQKNGHLHYARIRLMITRGEGAIMEEPMHSPQFLVESWEAKEYRFEEKGLNVDVFRDFPKNGNPYANIKTCNFLPSVMAVMFAKENKLDECLLLNEHNRISDATISNVFWIQNQQVYTIPLSEGGVAGVMRNYIMQLLAQRGMNVTESPISVVDIQNADEIFLTNVMRGLHCVGKMRNKTFENSLSKEIFEMILTSLG